MFATLNGVEESRKITVERITYGVTAALPLLIFLHLVFDPGQTKDERFRDLMLGWIMIFINIPIVLVGIGVLLRQRQLNNPRLFWSIAVFVSAVPLLFIVFSLVLVNIAGIHVRPFT